MKKIFGWFWFLCGMWNAIFMINVDDIAKLENKLWTGDEWYEESNHKKLIDTIWVGGSTFVSTFFMVLLGPITNIIKHILSH